MIVGRGVDFWEGGFLWGGFLGKGGGKKKKKKRGSRDCDDAGQSVWPEAQWSVKRH